MEAFPSIGFRLKNPHCLKRIKFRIVIAKSVKHAPITLNGTITFNPE